MWTSGVCACEMRGRDFQFPQTTGMHVRQWWWLAAMVGKREGARKGPAAHPPVSTKTFQISILVHSPLHTYTHTQKPCVLVKGVQDLGEKPMRICYKTIFTGPLMESLKAMHSNQIRGHRALFLDPSFLFLDKLCCLSYQRTVWSALSKRKRLHKDMLSFNMLPQHFCGGGAQEAKQN